ncbi:serine hydrolase [Bacillus wiedmannii]|uniref:Beta-lactamase class A catalytic domain-containing protein n=1 Tax=Bacillus wiedmannii TaxID=1890302 RepID=A0A2A7BL71_9BACI|nr:serine hydrolase [Bacillus wiedmannii]PDY35899.1 hypothetical protein COO17_25375 [Bacillus wiedmannii]
MQTVIERMKEIQSGQVGVIVSSTKSEDIIASYNNELYVPLASAAKVAIGFAVANMVKNKQISWNDMLHQIKFNPKEDSAQLYPHLQGRDTISLSKAVKVMIACHDSYIAKAIVLHCGGWDTVRKYVSTYFPNIHVQENPRDEQNVGELNEIHSLLVRIFRGYKTEPELWEPIINIGILGVFNEFPLLYVIGGKDLSNRFENKEADETIASALKYIYDIYIVKAF